MASDIDTIVNRLNEVLKPTIPFTLVSFDELRDRELSKVLNDLCAHLQPEIKVNVVSEDPAVVGQKHYDFLTNVLGFKATGALEAALLPGLTQGQPKVIRPILLWLLNQLPAHEKRVYLAKFLLPVDIPDDVRATTEGIAELWDVNENLRKQFIENHKAVEKYRKLGADPDEVLKEIAEAESDREQLQEQANRVRQRYESTGMARQPKFLAAARSIRAAEESQEASKKRLDDQQGLLNSVSKQLSVLRMRLAAAQKDKSDNVPVPRLVAKVQEDVAQHNLLLSERLPADIAKKKEQITSLDAVLTQRVDLEAEKQAVIGLTADIKNIETKHRPKLSEKEEAALGIYRQQAALVAKRRAAAQEELDRLEAEHLTVDKQRDEREKDLEQYRGSRILVGEEFKKYATSLRGKKELFLSKKAELQELRGEYGVLLRTVELLKSRDDRLEEIVADLEQKAGVSGARDVARQAEEAAQRRMAAEELKGKTLDELTKIVEEFEDKIKARRKQLAPHIVELRVLRLKSQQVEQEYLAKKEQYEGAKAVHGQDLMKTLKDVTTCIDDAMSAETMWHCLNVQMMMLEVQGKRMDDEKKYKDGKGQFSSTHPTFEDVLVKEIQQLEMQTQVLRDKKKNLDDNHQLHAKQVIWFRSLKRLLDMKLLLQKREEQRDAAAAGARDGEQDYLRIEHEGKDEEETGDAE
eukprot:TRINITY_DN3170_c0_g2_i1.p1 TRINITY_DN3170_c0_g2~~TRINITY_DN3170_c0_g2_i1.p1  ORF type:complete len:693 (-),score=204.81 TRINITY_DN3170_c0_g2_i1:1657-3735(-)